MPTLAEQKAALEKQLRDIATQEQAQASAKDRADEAFLLPVLKRLQEYRFHATDPAATALVVRAVLTELGLYKPPESKE